MVIPTESNLGEDCALGELEDLFYEATNIVLDTVTDSEITYSNDAKLILIGNTCFTENSGVDVDEIPTEGFTLKTVGENLFILGKDYGVMYGVYELLERIVHYEYFLEDIYDLDKNVKELYLPDLNYSDSPDFQVRADGWGYGDLRTRTVEYTYPFMMNGVAPIHNTFEWFPKENYMKSHSGWYSDDGQQLCYTAHGNVDELEEMRATLLKKFKAQVAAYWGKGDFEKTTLSFTQQDNTYWCSCSACQKVISKAGANSATIIEFLNPIAREMKSWVEENFPGHDLDIAFFAYNASEKAPVKNAYGNIVPTVDSVIMEDILAGWPRSYPLRSRFRPGPLHPPPCS